MENFGKSHCNSREICKRLREKLGFLSKEVSAKNWKFPETPQVHGKINVEIHMFNFYKHYLEIIMLGKVRSSQN